VPAGLALIGLIVFFGMIRPAMKAALAPPPPPEPGQQLSAVVDDETALPDAGAPPALPAPKSNANLEAARALAKENPAAVANIVRGWVSGETA
jgi:flagellar M-ring protein FliF